MTTNPLRDNRKAATSNGYMRWVFVDVTTVLALPKEWVGEKLATGWRLKTFPFPLMAERSRGRKIGVNLIFRENDLRA